MAYELYWKSDRTFPSGPTFKLDSLMIVNAGTPQVKGYTRLADGNTVEELVDQFIATAKPNNKFGRGDFIDYLNDQLEEEAARVAEVAGGAMAGVENVAPFNIRIELTPYAKRIADGKKPTKAEAEARAKRKERTPTKFAKDPLDVTDPIRATTAMLTSGLAILTIGLGGSFAFVMPMFDNHKVVGAVLVAITVMVVILSWLWYVGYFRGKEATDQVLDKDGKVLAPAIPATPSKFKTHAVLVWGVLSDIYGWAKVKADAWSERLEADAEADRAQREREAKAKKRKEKKAEKAALLANPATPPP